MKNISMTILNSDQLVKESLGISEVRKARSDRRHERMLEDMVKV